jgi:HemK-related putative methylase
MDSSNTREIREFAFDALAATYDESFTRSPVGRALRAMVWERAATSFAGRERILELGCGTGEDTVWLARAGHRVVAVDVSAEMIRVARRKALATGCADRIEFHHLDMENLAALPVDGKFDGVFSNFGAVNCVRDPGALSRSVAARLTPGAPLMFVVMGRHVPWEWLWYSVRGQWRKAFRRLRRAGVEWRGSSISYPTPQALAAQLAPDFVVHRAFPIGCALPPTYAAPAIERMPYALRALLWIERRLAGSSVAARLSDHYLLEAVRAAPSLLESPRATLGRALLKRAIDVGYIVSGRRSYDRNRIEHVGGLRLEVWPTVSNPKILRTGAFFASCLDSSVVPPGTRVLDLGTGSGVCALAAARLVSGVVAVDINEHAVRCARHNAGLNGLAHRVDLRHGDLFVPVRGQHFDLVLFNPPFFNGMPRDARDAAWRSTDLAERFARELDAHLAPGGRSLLLLSSSGDACPRFENELRDRGFALSVFAVRRYVGETVTILDVRRP